MAGAAHAAAPVPTDINTGDCVAAYLAAPKGDTAHRIDLQYCTENNADAAARDTCLRNLRAVPEVRFFTDRCGESQGSFFLGIDGSEHSLLRVGPGPEDGMPFAGRFAGNGVQMSIRTGALLLRELDEDAPPGETPDVLREQYAVEVTIERAGERTEIDAVYHGGR